MDKTFVRNLRFWTDEKRHFGQRICCVAIDNKQNNFLYKYMTDKTTAASSRTCKQQYFTL